MVEVILEQGINANGDLCVAKKLIDVASAAGCNYVKFQKRNIDLVYSKEELDKPRESKWGTTTRQQKEGLEFNRLDYIELAFYCQQKNIQWFASPWDLDSLDFITEFPIPFIKIPSALITNTELLEACKTYTIPVILSTGMSDIGMVDEAIKILGKDKIYCIMACTSTYPTKPEESNVKCVRTLKERYPWTKIGFSNHYPGLMSMIMAYVLGAEMIEFHATLDRSMYGSDQSASIEPRGVFELMERLRLIEKMKGDGVKKIFESEIPIMQKLRR
jgi:N-acetylneuraminate synthase